MLLGGISAGVLTGCGPNNPFRAPVEPGAVYTNNYYLSGVGYYHAPFRQWYPLPYNHFDPQKQQYFYGGQWGATPHRSITNISSPMPEAVTFAETQRSDVPRGGFGSSWHSTGHWGGIHS